MKGNMRERYLYSHKLGDLPVLCLYWSDCEQIPKGGPISSIVKQTNTTDFSALYGVPDL